MLRISHQINPGLVHIQNISLEVCGVNHVVTAFKNAAVFPFPACDFFLQFLVFRNILEYFEPADDPSGSILKSGCGTDNGHLQPVNIGDGVLPVVYVVPLAYGAFQGAVGFADGILENILAIHSDSVVGGKACDFFRGRVEIGNPPFLVSGEEPIGNAVQDFHKTLFLLIESLQGFDVVFVDLVGEEMVPSSRMLFSFYFKKSAGQTVGQFFEKILFQEISASGSWNQPAVRTFLIVGRAENIDTGQQLPTRLSAVIILAFQRHADEMIFEQ